VTTVCFTIISKNYMAAARVFMASLRKVHPEIVRVVVLVDTVDGYFDPAQEGFDLVLADELSIPHWGHFSMKYDIMELNTAVKPYAISTLFDRYQAENVLYFDPDIVVYDSLQPLLDALAQHMVVLTPHIVDPLDDENHPGELDFLRVGTYNLGFIGLSRRGRWRELLDWWQRRLYVLCTREVDKGLFVDQHWVDLMPSLYDGVRVIRDPGYNVAYWNLKTRHLTEPTRGQVVVSGGDGDDKRYPLRFFHFSGFSVERPADVSRHQNRFTLPDVPAATQSCFNDYRDRLLKAGHQVTRHWPYHYGKFSDGVPIPDLLRRCLYEYDPDGRYWPDPYILSGLGSFRAWAVTPKADKRLTLLSPYAHTVYRAREDLRKAFPDIPGDHEAEYARWFVAQDSHDPVFNPYFVEPMRVVVSQMRKPTAILPPPPARPEPSSAALPTAPAAAVISAPAVSDALRTEVPIGKRVERTLRYYRRYPLDVQPYVPPHAIKVIPPVFTGPAGIYAGLRQSLKALRLLQPIRRLLGLRLILTARYYFSDAKYARPVSPVSAPPTPASGAVTPAAAVASAPTPSERDGQHTRYPFGANVIGYVYSETGVGQLARNTLRSLDASRVPLNVHPLQTYDQARKQDRYAERFSQGTSFGINLFQANADMTYPVRGLLEPSVYEGHYNIGHWAWELAQFPDQWQPCFDAYDEIWVCSAFVQDAVARRATIPVLRMPACVEPEPPEALDHEAVGLPPDRFLVTFVFDANSVIERKNPFALIDAYERAFSEAERGTRTHLVIKAMNLSSYPDVAVKLRQRITAANGTLLEGYLSRRQTNALIAASGAYASLHRSEGLGLTISEAMYYGVPVIATAYSGNMDAMTAHNSYPVPYRLVELARDHGPYRAGNVWAEPEVAAAADALHEVFTHPDAAKARGERAAHDIRTHFSAQAVGKVLAARLALIAANFAPSNAAAVEATPSSNGARVMA
jgi:glycosyltransferase involved in cell wall biosynthesis